MNDNEKCTTITKAGSLETGDATLTGILMALVAGFFGVLEETVRRKNASNAVVFKKYGNKERYSLTAMPFFVFYLSTC